ncbi:MAG TPA: phosphoglycerate kinase [Chlamydiales bacterium]|jgi:phosphoglycerate kinase
MTLPLLSDLSLKGHRVLLRVDFNVPLQNGIIADDSRIKAALPSIEYILSHGASIVLMSHLGRPKGKDPTCSLAPCAKRLSELLNKPVQLAPDCIGPPVEMMANQLRPGEILLLENLRFYPGEENPEKDPSFALALSKLGDMYVNDAFGTAHRPHASTALIASYFPGKRAVGLLMQKELDALSPLLKNPKRPFYAIMGGAKLSTKLGVIQNLLKIVDGLFLGGGMTYSFLKAKGIPIGDSLYEESELPKIKELLDHPKIHLPSDLVIAKDAAVQTIPIGQAIPAGWQGMDVGPKTIDTWSKTLRNGKTIFWNGPVGVFEMPQFAKGTQDLANVLAILCQSGARVIVGGGDSVSAIEQMGLGNRFSHLSTGGGASLEYLEYGHLPGLDALTRN